MRTFTYDNRNRKIASDWSDGSQKIVKAYDEAGRMTLEDNGVSKLTFVFDVTGRLVSETQDLSAIVTGGSYDPEPRKVSYGYTADGQKASLMYPDGSFVRYTYNARGQLMDILGDGLPPPIASYEYDLAGNATRIPRENLTETERQFDEENKLTSITERAPHCRPLSELDSYDEIGNRTSTTTTNYEGEDRRTVRDAYLYDETYHVTGADYAAPTRGNDIGSPAARQATSAVYSRPTNRRDHRYEQQAWRLLSTSRRPRQCRNAEAVYRIAAEYEK